MLEEVTKIYMSSVTWIVPQVWRAPFDVDNASRPVETHTKIADRVYDENSTNFSHDLQC